MLCIRRLIRLGNRAGGQPQTTRKYRENFLCLGWQCRKFCLLLQNYLPGQIRQNVFCLERQSLPGQMCVCIYIYICVCVCIYICVCVCVYIYIKSSVKYGISGLRSSQIKDIYGSERVCSLTTKLYSHDVSCKSSPLKCIFFAQWKVDQQWLSNKCY